MASCLITHILVGPKSLERTEREEAVKYAVRRMKTWQCVLDESKHPQMTDDEIELAEELFDAVGLEPPDVEWVVGLEEADLEVRAARACDALYTVWDGSAATDTNSRDLDDDRKIVVAGDSSWGEEPAGLGWETLRDAYRIGLLEFFAIE